MKTPHVILTRCLLSLALFFSIHSAFGFYDPSAQRWVNRDPIGEPGFEKMRVVTELDKVQTLVQKLLAEASLAERANLYSYVRNRPMHRIDPLGLEPMLPPGWHGPGQPYDPSSNPFCKPGPPCVAEGATALALSAVAVITCAYTGPGSALCLAALGAATGADVILTVCLKNAGIIK